MHSDFSVPIFWINYTLPSSHLFLQEHFWAVAGSLFKTPQKHFIALIPVKICWYLLLCLLSSSFFCDILISLENYLTHLKDHDRINYQGTPPFLTKRWTWDIAQPIRFFLKFGFQWSEIRKGNGWIRLISFPGFWTDSLCSYSLYFYTTLVPKLSKVWFSGFLSDLREFYSYTSIKLSRL